MYKWLTISFSLIVLCTPIISVEQEEKPAGEVNPDEGVLYFYAITNGIDLKETFNYTFDLSTIKNKPSALTLNIFNPRNSRWIKIETKPYTDKVIFEINGSKIGPLLGEEPFIGDSKYKLTSVNGEFILDGSGPSIYANLRNGNAEKVPFKDLNNYSVEVFADRNISVDIYHKNQSNVSDWERLNKSLNVSAGSDDWKLLTWENEQRFSYLEFNTTLIN